MGSIQSMFRSIWHTFLRGYQHIRGCKSTETSASTASSDPQASSDTALNTPSDSSQTTCNSSITFSTASHNARPFPKMQTMSSLQFLKKACPDVHAYTLDILHSSMRTPFAIEDIKPQRNGFVHTILECYNKHRALIIRPDDVWLAIMTQFSCFVNGNAEDLRSLFVLHEGKKELCMVMNQKRGEEDWDLVVRTLVATMNEKIQENVIDPELRQWIIPAFSTTTPLDVLVSGMVMMATVKEYFDFRIMLCCGIPRVTLEGEKSDWEFILNRIEKLKEFGPKTNAWYHLLHPVLSRFVKAFDDPNGQENLDFWGKVAHYERGGSGPTWLSGWITAFMVFDEKGQWTPDKQRRDYEDSELILDGVSYPFLDSDEIPAGYAQVDVTLQREIGGKEYPTALTAGLIGTRICSSGDKTLSDAGERDSARPAIGCWWVLKKDPEAKEENSDLGQSPDNSESSDDEVSGGDFVFGADPVSQELFEEESDAGYPVIITPSS
ncbi:hypothetical protein DEU56DRAFT_95395 [Suillus clintonianus]|uniref:uncharacterized protein n=1 Tax=Suillus clintonianus TaxID=1904413 RepID=UPI001B86EC50|nr:uncharacterized protein DEU56DRAFT_95395 [Suillus clintonianus]KAG2121625.1 hypothetical protein DEU56DRAFT_95395 [Suillus clintonianus]